LTGAARAKIMQSSGVEMLVRITELAGCRVRGRRRGGATLVEFAVIAPVLMIILGCIADYGWYFYREDLVVNVLQEAARTGGIKKQVTGEAENACAACTAAANTAATTGLAGIGITGVTISSSIVRVPSSGTPCYYAIEMSPSISHPRFFGLVPTPSNIQVRVVALAQNLVTCS
jgi:Flp pilus assembly protein TadG